MTLEAKIAALYLGGKTITEIAADVELPWPQVHMIVFEMKRAGQLPKRPRKAAA